MDHNMMFSVNINDVDVSDDRRDSHECQMRIFELYFYVLLEYINKNRISEIKLNDLIYSKECILISEAAECQLRKRFQGCCDRLHIDYAAVGHAIPLDCPYSLAAIVGALHHYRSLEQTSAAIAIAHSDDCVIHYRPVAAAPVADPCADPVASRVCVSPRHCVASLTASKSLSYSSNLPALLLEKNNSLRPATITPDLKHLNDLSTIDYDVLQAAEMASQKWICKATRKSSDPTGLKTNDCAMEEWSTVMYYELNCRVGDPFVSATPIVTIDGFTSPSMRSSRFSLGHLSNVSRSSKIEETRKFIGKGAKLYYIKGELFLECLSDNAIFAQSPLSNITAGWHPATITKIPPKCNIKVFSEKDFNLILSQHELGGFEAVFSLKPLCSIRISFVKGWGASYSRQTITTTPCWIEVHLNQPLKCLDTALRYLETPSTQCSSRS